MWTKLFFSLSLVLTLLLPSKGSVLAAAGDTPSEAIAFSTGKTFTVSSPTGYSGVDYLGILISRYSPTTANSTDALTYTNKLTYAGDGMNEWFIPAAEASAGTYSFAFNSTAEYHKRLFEKVGSHDTYKIVVYHVFRLPDGRDLKSEPLDIFYKLASATPPTVVWNAPAKKVVRMDYYQQLAVTANDPSGIATISYRTLINGTPSVSPDLTGSVAGSTLSKEIYLSSASDPLIVEGAVLTIEITTTAVNGAVDVKTMKIKVDSTGATNPNMIP